MPADDYAASGINDKHLEEGESLIEPLEEGNAEPDSDSAVTGYDPQKDRRTQV